MIQQMEHREGAETENSRKGAQRTTANTVSFCLLLRCQRSPALLNCLIRCRAKRLDDVLALSAFPLVLAPQPEQAHNLPAFPARERSFWLELFDQPKARAEEVI
jgi:hypothetical protein